MTLLRLTKHPIVQLALYAAIYSGFCLLVFLPSPIKTLAIPILAVTGFVLAALFLRPRREWPCLLLVTVIISLGVNRWLLNIPWQQNLGMVLVGLAQVIAQAWLVTLWAGGPVRFDRTRPVVVLLGSVAVTNAIGALIVGRIVNHYTGDELTGYVWLRFANQSLSAIMLVPLIVTWAPEFHRARTWKLRHFLQGALLLGGTMTFVSLALHGYQWLNPYFPAPYLLVLPVLLLAIRHGTRGATVATMVVTVYVIWAFADGGLLTHTHDLQANLAAARMFLGVVATTGLLLGASVAEKDASAAILRESEERFRAMFENSTSAVALLRDDVFTLTNPAFLKLVGAGSPAEWIRRPWRDLVAAEDQPRLQAALDRALRGDKGDDALRVQGLRAGSSRFPMEIRLDAFAVGGSTKVVVNCRDLTEELRARNELERVNRALRTASRCNHVLIHATDELKFLQDLCGVIVGEGGYRLAWVGVAEDDESKTVRPIAWAGAARSYAENLKISWADVPRGRGPTGTAIRTGEAVVNQNILGNPAMAPWHEQARQFGLNSSLVFPLRIEGRVFGALTIYSTDIEAFDAGEFALLAELAVDLVFGIQSLRTRQNRDRAEADVRRLLADAEEARQQLLEILEERKLAEEARKHSDQLYRDAMQNSAIGMSLVALDGRWLEVNPALCQILGYTREELLAREFQSLTHPADRGPDIRKLEQLIAGEIRAFEHEKRYLHKSGRSVWVWLHSSVVRDAQGKPLHLVTQTQDITARKEAEELLAAAAERLALALRVSKFGVWRHNLQTRAIEWDARMFGIFGLPDAVIAPSLDQILELVVEEDRAAVLRSWNARPTCNHTYLLRFRARRPDGKIRHIELQGTVHDDSLGRPEWAIGVAGDMTEIVEASIESERLRAQLLQSQKMETLGTLAAGVAHDFNNLLTGINGFVELASASVGPGHEAADLLKQARRGAMSARDLVRRILGFSRSSKDNKRSLLNVVDVVRDTAPLVAAAMPANISLTLAVECDAAPVLADSGQLQQVLMNLCTNGAHAIGAKAGKIQIGVQLQEIGVNGDEATPPGCAPGRHARISVSDTGCGMSEATQKRIFEPFFTTKQEGEGTGLGLPIVRDIVTAHEGGLSVTSAPGAGTTFAIFLPIAARETETLPASIAGPLVRGTGQRVLVVDDEPSVAAVVRLTLKKSGYDPVIFTSSQEAWETIQSTAGSFDLLIVDQNMPEISGREFIGRVRKLAPALPVVLMSGRFENGPALAALGAEQIKKPFEISELLATVRGVLDRAARAAPRAGQGPL